MCFAHCKDKKHQRHIGQSIGMDAKFAGDGISMAQNAGNGKRSVCAMRRRLRLKRSTLLRISGQKMRLAA